VSTLPDASWVFGYGSLMWNPGFPFMEQQPAVLEGYHRAFCIYSHHHRGSPDTPGLVLGLDAGGRCQGVAFHIAADDWASTVAYLDDRELVGDAYPYRPTVLEVTTPAGVRRAYTYVADRAHPNYAGALEPDAALSHILAAEGVGGTNRDYLINLVHQLEDRGYVEDHLHRLLARAEAGPAAGN